MIAVTFACGHAGTTDGESVPTCPTCDERRIRRVQARPPRFVGACRGPVATETALDAIALNLTTGGSLKLKESES